MLNILDFGAVGDGQTDNTSSIQTALDAAADKRSSVFFPAGHYMTSTLRVPSYCGLVGQASWGYRDVGGAILQINDPKATALLDVTGKFGISITGLCLEGKCMGECIHGVALDNDDFGGAGGETTLLVDNCRIHGFSGHGVYLNRAWCFSIRHCMIAGNQGDGIWLRGWDGFILDNWLSGNEQAGFGAYEENASVTFTANRVEWNFKAGVEIHGGDHYNINNNFFDRHGGPAIDLCARGDVPASQITVTGNVLYRNGKPSRCPDEPYSSAHIRCRNAEAIVITSNVCQSGRDDSNSDTGDGDSPEWGMVLGHLENSIVKDNVFHRGYRQNLLVDLGNHRGTVIIKDNIGSRDSDCTDVDALEPVGFINGHAQEQGAGSPASE